MEENEIEKDNETMCVKYKKVTLKKKILFSRLYACTDLQCFLLIGHLQSQQMFDS